MAFAISPSGACASDWSVDCEGDACVVAQSAAAEDRTWLATVLIEPLDEGAAQAQLFVPAGVHLASGLFVGVKDRPLRTEFIDCDAMSCRASLQLNRADLTGWKKAREAEVRYRPSLGGPVISFPLSLMGLTAALRSLEGPK
ncbi:MAG: invasion associated locus B family protein [Rhodobacter sp.]|nr:invasion associated locus B family protein [Rhodobacter sp.]